MKPEIMACMAWIGLAISAPLSVSTAYGESSQIMPMGVFHFANPGLDLVRTEQIDVLSEGGQTYLESLTTRLATFRPTHVLLECEAEESQDLNDDYELYLGNSFTLEVNENHQLGFRIARKSGLELLYCYDDTSIPWLAGALFDYMENYDPEAQQKMGALIEQLTEQTEIDHRTLSLQQLLHKANDPGEDILNKGLYLLTNSVGAGDGFSGAEAAASWWHRNFRMYANIQRIAGPDSRVLVIGGQGHTAIFRDFVALDPERTLVDVLPYLE